MNKMSALKQKCLLEELTKHVDKSYIGFYNAFQLTKNSSVESFSYKNKHLVLLRVNGTAILLVKISEHGEIIVQRVCEEHNLNKESSRAIRKFCYKFTYKTTYRNGLKYAPKYSYIKEHLLNYVQINPLEWAVDLI